MEGEVIEEGDILYVDDGLLNEMDLMEDEEDDDFKTMKESELGDEEMYLEGQILDEMQVENDSICQLQQVHMDHVYCVAQLPLQPFNTFVSGDGDDKCYVWTIRPKQQVEETKGEEATAEK